MVFVPAVRAGALDRQIELQKLTVTRTAAGEQVESWAHVRYMNAERSPLSVATLFASNQAFAEANTVWRVRFYPSFANLDVITNRVIYRDRIYKILGVQEIGRREGLYIITKSRDDSEGEP